MQAGTYCVDSFKLTSTTTLTGMNGVFIYIEPGGDFSLQGGTVKIQAPSNGDYKGLLIFVATNYQGAAKNCTINGNGADVFIGTIYAPYCDITINGSTTTVGFQSQIIGYEVKLNGSSQLNVTYDPNGLWQWFVPPKLGLVK
jgi:hypothetical protein